MSARAVALALLVAAGAASPARADGVEDFYRGRNIDLVIGFPPGGVYDFYARLIAQFMGDHVPGKPRIVARTLAGAGSRTAAGFLANVAPKDGTALAMASQGLALEQALGTKATFDVTRFVYIGNPSQENNSTVVWAASGVRTFDDVRRREATVGSTGDDPSSQYPKVMNALFGAKFRIISGYPGSNDINIAMERGEVDGRGSSAVAEWKSSRADWYRDGKINILVQIGLAKASFLPDTPLLTDLATNDADRDVARLLSGPMAIGRAIFAAPDTPPDRARALRAAFDATMRDPAFIAATARQNLDLSPLSGADLQRVVEDIARSPDAVTRRLGAILGR